MNSRPSLLLALGALVALTGLFVGLGATQATSPDQAATERLRQVGEARASAESVPVASIDQETVTLDEFQEKVRVVETNLEYMKGEIAAGSPNAAYLEAFVNLIEQAGTHDVALATLIQERALYQRARTSGYTVTDQEITARLEQDRDLVRTRDEGAKAEAYIEAVGEDRYWSELYPAILRREMTTHKMWADVVADIEDPQGRATAWKDVQRQAVGAATIDVLAPDAVAPATVRGALDYLDAYWELAA